MKRNIVFIINEEEYLDNNLYFLLKDLYFINDIFIFYKSNDIKEKLEGKIIYYNKDFGYQFNDLVRSLILKYNDDFNLLIIDSKVKSNQDFSFLENIFKFLSVKKNEYKIIVPVVDSFMRWDKFFIVLCSSIFKEFGFFNESYEEINLCFKEYSERILSKVKNIKNFLLVLPFPIYYEKILFENYNELNVEKNNKFMENINRTENKEFKDFEIEEDVVIKDLDENLNFIDNLIVLENDLVDNNINDINDVSGVHINEDVIEVKSENEGKGNEDRKNENLKVENIEELEESEELEELEESEELEELKELEEFKNWCGNEYYDIMNKLKNNFFVLEKDIKYVKEIETRDIKNNKVLLLSKSVFFENYSKLKDFNKVYIYKYDNKLFLTNDIFQVENFTSNFFVLVKLVENTDVLFVIINNYTRFFILLSVLIMQDKLPSNIIFIDNVKDSKDLRDDEIYLYLMEVLNSRNYNWKYFWVKEISGIKELIKNETKEGDIVIICKDDIYGIDSCTWYFSLLSFFSKVDGIIVNSKNNDFKLIGYVKKSMNDNYYFDNIDSVNNKNLIEYVF